MKSSILRISSLREAHRWGIGIIVSGLALGIAFAGLMAGWFGPSPSALLRTSTSSAEPGDGVPRPRQGLILTAENKGQVLFGRYCDSCHPGGEEGRGKSLISTQFLRDFQKDSDVTQLAREGTCIMPKFGRFLLADGDMGEVSKFVVSRAKASTQGASPLPPLDGASILGQRCANCHDGNNIPYINPRDPDTLKTLETEMATCAGLTVDQRKVLREYLLAEQSR